MSLIDCVTLSHGVTGNTSDFGSEESWFDPRWGNDLSFQPMTHRWTTTCGSLCYPLSETWDEEVEVAPPALHAMKSVPLGDGL